MVDNENNVPTLIDSPVANPSPVVGQVLAPFLGHDSSSQVVFPMFSSHSIPFMVHSEKPEKFSGNNFKRWQQKMLFYLTTLSLVRFLKEDPPVIDEDDIDIGRRIAYDQWVDGDYLCRNYILGGLVDTLYDVYSVIHTAKEMWNSLERKYVSEDACSKKFIVGKFLDFKMVDNKSIIEQIQKFQLILHDIRAKGMVLPDSFQTASIIEKLPPSWRDFKSYLKLKKEMSMEYLIIKLRIEENRRMMLNPNVSIKVFTNLMGYGEPSKKQKRLDDFKGKKPVSEKLKFTGDCYNCGKPNHKARNCNTPKMDEYNAKMVERNLTDVENLYLLNK